ncbi:MAG: hypothetical protein GQ529_02055 [Methyloprofundus sp.]|nr:hypothetical protein [Methyloprofundus sp.]
MRYKGESVVHFTADYRGIPVLTAYTSLSVMGRQWAILSEIDQSEILHPVHVLRDRLIITAIIIVIFTVIVSIMLVSSFKRS